MPKQVTTKGKSCSAVTGRYVKKSYAKTHAKTTVPVHDKKKPNRYLFV